MVIFMFLIAGLLLHGSLVNYANAVKNAARQTGAMMLQYPIYGGIVGIMTVTGLAEEMSRSIASVATSHPLLLPSWCPAVVATGRCRGPSRSRPPWRYMLPFRPPPWAWRWARRSPT